MDRKNRFSFFTLLLHTLLQVSLVVAGFIFEKDFNRSDVSENNNCTTLSFVFGQIIGSKQLTNTVVFYNKTDEQSIFKLTDPTAAKAYEIQTLNLKELTQIFYKKRHEMFIVIYGNNDFTIEFFKQANTLDKKLEQQGYFTDVYKFIIINPSPCQDLENSLGNITHVLCLTKTFYTNSEQSNEIECFSAVWHPRGRGFQKIGQITEGNFNFIEPFNAFFSKNLNFNGRKLKMVTNYWAGYVEKKFDRNNQSYYTGINIEMAHNLEDIFNFTYEIVIPEDLLWGSVNENGEWTGIVKVLQDRNGDFVGAPFSTNEHRSKVLDFAETPWEILQFTGMYRKQGESSSSFINLLLKPLDPHVWKLSAFILLLVAAVLAIITDKKKGHSLDCVITDLTSSAQAKPVKNYQSYYKNKMSVFITNNLPYFSKRFIKYIALLLKAALTQCAKIPQRKRSRDVWGAWIIFCVVITAIWSAELISYLTATKEKAPFNTIMEVAEQDEYSIGTMGGTLIEFILRQSKVENDQKLWRKIVEHQDDGSLDADHHVHVDNVQKEKYVYLQETTTLMDIVMKNCEMALITDSLHELRYAFGLQKNSAYTSEFNKATLHMLETGVVSYLHRKYFGGLDSCDRETTKHGGVQISMKHSMSLVSVFWAALLSSGIVLLAEIIMSKIKNHVRNNFPQK